jgi:transposase-like protein
VNLVIAEDHKGLRAAASEVFHASQQRYKVHWMHNALAHASAKERPAVAATLKTIFLRCRFCSGGSLRAAFPSRMRKNHGTRGWSQWMMVG